MSSQSVKIQVIKLLILIFTFNFLDARNEQNANEEVFDQPVPANEAVETPEEIRNLLHTPPVEQHPDQQNEEHAEQEQEPRDDNFEVWTPEHEHQQNEPEPERNEPERDVLMEDGLDAETAALAQARNDDGNEQPEAEQAEPEQPEPAAEPERHEQVILFKK
jgi:hypothetical protein